MEHPFEQADVVSVDWICVSCSYNLRGLAKTSRCPECNTPIVRSLRRGTLAGSDPNWLGAVRDGALIVATCNLVYVAREIALILMRYAAYKRSLALLVAPYRRTLSSEPEHLIVLGATLIGLWLLTKLEPRPLTRGSVRAAIHIRQLSVCAIVATLIYSFLLRNGFIIEVREAWSILETLLSMLVGFLIWRYLAALSQRLHEPRLIDRASTLRWLYPLGIAFASLLYQILYFFHLASMRQYPTAFTILECLQLVVETWAAIVLFQIAAAIKKVRSEPGQNV